MTILQILLILNILSGRLFFDRDTYAAKKLFWFRSIFTLIACLFAYRITEMMLLLVLSSIVILIDLYWLRDNIKFRYTIYLLALFLFLPGIVALCEPLLNLYPIKNPLSQPLMDLLLNIPFIANLSIKFEPNYLLLILTMYLFTIKESTIIIRGILDSIKAIPQKEKEEKDEEEYNRGKYIGILERTFIYFLIIIQQYAAIGIILGLKSFARFKELDKRGFAEYFLIGSMLSILTALLPAIYVIIQF